MALTLLCVVMLIDAQTQQHKLILLLQTERKRKKKKGKKRQLFGKYIALYNEHLEIPSHRAAGREGEKNLPALIVCVGLGAT